MEYMTGVGVTDIDALKREGLNPAEVCNRCHNRLPAYSSNHPVCAANYV